MWDKHNSLFAMTNKKNIMSTTWLLNANPWEKTWASSLSLNIWTSSDFLHALYAYRWNRQWKLVMPKTNRKGFFIFEQKIHEWAKDYKNLLT
jgi:hypothetical protein